MKQEQLKQQFLEYAEFNLQNDIILQAIIELLDNIQNKLYENGYKRESNRITTAELIIKELLENCEKTYY